jgi:hypothetical protein
MMSPCPEAAAQWSGVLSLLSFAVALAPESSSILATVREALFGNEAAAASTAVPRRSLPPGSDKARPDDDTGGSWTAARQGPTVEQAWCSSVRPARSTPWTSAGSEASAWTSAPIKGPSSSGDLHASTTSEAIDAGISSDEGSALIKVTTRLLE